MLTARSAAPICANFDSKLNPFAFVLASHGGHPSSIPYPLSLLPPFPPPHGRICDGVGREMCVAEKEERESEKRNSPGESDSSSFLFLFGMKAPPFLFPFLFSFVSGFKTQTDEGEKGEGGGYFCVFLILSLSTFFSLSSRVATPFIIKISFLPPSAEPF